MSETNYAPRIVYGTLSNIERMDQERITVYTYRMISFLLRILRGGNSETGFSPIPMLTYGESLPHDNSLCNLID